jgi:hypothetical protein
MHKTLNNVDKEEAQCNLQGDLYASEVTDYSRVVEDL